jgi:nucleotide-binding universal stress UspA family protein
MEPFKNILVVSRSTKNCPKVLKTGISLAQKYNAKLHLLHIIHDPFGLDGWNLPVPSFEAEYKKMVADIREELHRMIQAQKSEGLVVCESLEEGVPVDAIKRKVEEDNVDLILMLGHKEGRLEHFLFGKTNDAIIRSLPATLMLIK